MQTESVELGFLSILALITFFIFFNRKSIQTKIINGIFTR